MLKQRYEFRKELLILFVTIIIAEKSSGCHRSEAQSKPAHRGPFNGTITFTVGRNADLAFIYLFEK